MEQLLIAGIGFLLSIPVVYAFVQKFSMPLEEVGKLLVDVAKAVEDGKITAEEIKKIKEDIGDVGEVIKRIRGDK